MHVHGTEVNEWDHGIYLFYRKIREIFLENHWWYETYTIDININYVLHMFIKYVYSL